MSDALHKCSCIQQHSSSDRLFIIVNIICIYRMLLLVLLRTAPMKALAQEVVAKFSARLAPLGLVVREYTGDMQLTKQEIADSHLLVSTPEKFDVSTRKGGDGTLGTMVSLLIIDEVHLLADDRGAVIETIVARTQRYVETAQTMVTICRLLH